MRFCPTCHQEMKPGLTHGLTREQWAVAALIYDGLSYKEIAERLGATTKAVKARALQVHRRWNVHSKTQVILKYLELKSLADLNKDDKA